MKKRMRKLISALSEGLHEREEIIAIALLASLAGEHTFFLGPPGTAKSLVSRRLSSAFGEGSYFECLMNRFTTPEEVLGPVSITALKEDIYQRKTEGYLPQACFAFLDEIWKSSPAILNTLLTLINERTFRNAGKTVKVPLKTMIAASNEIPEEGQGLEALYDRFLVRLLVPPMVNKCNFEALLNGRAVRSLVEPDRSLAISESEMTEWQEGIQKVLLSKETLKIIHLIRKELTKQSEKLEVYVSDRRWQKAAGLLKASAFFCGRNRTNHSDALLLRYCLWSSLESREAVQSIVDNAVKCCGFETEFSLNDLDREKANLDKAIREELFYGDDIYITIEMGGNSYFKTTVQGDEEVPFELYIDARMVNTEKDFSPVDVCGNEYTSLVCNFQNQGACRIQGNAEDEHEDIYEIDTDFTPAVASQKGDFRAESNQGLVASLAGSVHGIRKRLEEALVSVEVKKDEQKLFLDSPFLSSSVTDIAFQGMIQQIEDIKLRIKDCDRLLSLAGSFADV